MVKEKPESCTHHLHLVKIGSKYWSDNLFFREYMKDNRCKADKYRSLKLDLAKQGSGVGSVNVGHCFKKYDKFNVVFYEYSSVYAVKAS